MNLRPIDRISLLVAALLEGTKAGGISDATAKSVYDSLMPSYAKMLQANPEFADLLFMNVEKAIRKKAIDLRQP